MEVSSPAFHLNGKIPEKYTCNGKDVSPPLYINDIPPGTESLAIIVEDPDAPKGTWTHWIVWNIDPKYEIEEGQIPGIEGLNDFGKYHYGGPCPPWGTHRYFFKVFALKKRLEIDQNSKKEDLLKAMKGQVLATAELIGVYESG